MNKKLYLVTILLFLLTVALELLSIHLGGMVASHSVAVRTLQSSIAKLEEQNQILNSKVLSVTSFDTIASKAAALGFVEDHKYISLQAVKKFSYSR